MRTTVSLDDDVVAAVERLRAEKSMGLSEAVNDLIRRGLQAPPTGRPFQQRTHRLDLRIDVTNVAEALEQLEGPAAR